MKWSLLTGKGLDITTANQSTTWHSIPKSGYTGFKRADEMRDSGYLRLKGGKCEELQVKTSSSMRPIAIPLSRPVHND